MAAPVQTNWRNRVSIQLSVRIQCGVVRTRVMQWSCNPLYYIRVVHFQSASSQSLLSYTILLTAGHPVCVKLSFVETPISWAPIALRWRTDHQHHPVIGPHTISSIHIRHTDGWERATGNPDHIVARVHYATAVCKSTILARGAMLCHSRYCTYMLHLLQTFNQRAT